MAAGTYVYIGTYSKAGSRGIYVYRLDAQAGQIHDTGQAAPAQNASFLALHPDGRALYAVSEVDQVDGGSADQSGGGVIAFAIDTQTGGLALLNEQSSRGAGPCHLAVDASGRLLAVANYSGGSIASLPIREDGSLGHATAFFQHVGSSVDPQRQREPHAHSITIDVGNRFALACDLGLDKILAYPIDAAGEQQLGPQVLAAPARAGAGPRHFVFHPLGRFGYAINELDSTVSAYAYDPERGQLQEIQSISTLPSGFSGQSSAADIQVAPSGRFLYGSNRGHDSIVIYSIDQETGCLALVGHESTRGKTPRNFAIDPSGAFLLAANQDSDSVVVFRVDEQSGRLAPTGQSVEVPSPVCVKFRAP